MKITWVILCHRFLTCRRKDNICILKNLEVSGFLTSKINASNLKASRCYTNHQVQYMDDREFCFETAAQSEASDLVSLSDLAFGFLIDKEEACTNISKPFWLWQFMNSMVCLKVSQKRSASCPRILDGIFLQDLFLFPLQYALANNTRHLSLGNKRNRAPHFLSTLTSFLWETLKDISDG